MNKSSIIANNDTTAEPSPSRSPVIMSAADRRSEPFDSRRNFTFDRSSVGNPSVPDIATQADNLLSRVSSAQAYWAGNVTSGNIEDTSRHGDVLKEEMDTVSAARGMGGANPAQQVGGVDPEGEVGGIHSAEEVNGANPGGEVGGVNTSQQSDGGQQNKGEVALTSECCVCGSPAAAHLHYGAISCYSCRAFFRRGPPRQMRCIFGNNECKINKYNRTNCKYCRYNRCIQVGMIPEKVDATLKKKQERLAAAAAAAAAAAVGNNETAAAATETANGADLDKVASDAKKDASRAINASDGLSLTSPTVVSSRKRASQPIDRLAGDNIKIESDAFESGEKAVDFSQQKGKKCENVFGCKVDGDNLSIKERLSTDVDVKIMPRTIMKNEPLSKLKADDDDCRYSLESDAPVPGPSRSSPIFSTSSAATDLCKDFNLNSKDRQTQASPQSEKKKIHADFINNSQSALSQLLNTRTPTKSNQMPNLQVSQDLFPRAGNDNLSRVEPMEVDSDTKAANGQNDPRQQHQQHGSTANQIALGVGAAANQSFDRVSCETENSVESGLGATGSKFQVKTEQLPTNLQMEVTKKIHPVSSTTFANLQRSSNGRFTGHRTRLPTDNGTSQHNNYLNSRYLNLDRSSVLRHDAFPHESNQATISQAFSRSSQNYDLSVQQNRLLPTPDHNSDVTLDQNNCRGSNISDNYLNTKLQTIMTAHNLQMKMSPNGLSYHSSSAHQSAPSVAVPTGGSRNPNTYRQTIISSASARSHQQSTGQFSGSAYPQRLNQNQTSVIQHHTRAQEVSSSTTSAKSHRGTLIQQGIKTEVNEKTVLQDREAEEVNAKDNNVSADVSINTEREVTAETGRGAACGTSREAATFGAARTALDNFEAMRLAALQNAPPSNSYWPLNVSQWLPSTNQFFPYHPPNGTIQPRQSLNTSQYSIQSGIENKLCDPNYFGSTHHNNVQTFHNLRNQQAFDIAQLHQHHMNIASGGAFGPHSNSNYSYPSGSGKNFVSTPNLPGNKDIVPLNLQQQQSSGGAIAAAPSDGSQWRPASNSSPTSGSLDSLTVNPLYCNHLNPHQYQAQSGQLPLVPPVAGMVSNNGGDPDNSGVVSSSTTSNRDVELVPDLQTLARFDFDPSLQQATPYVENLPESFDELISHATDLDYESLSSNMGSQIVPELKYDLSDIETLISESLTDNSDRSTVYGFRADNLSDCELDNIFGTSSSAPGAATSGYDRRKRKHEEVSGESADKTDNKRPGLSLAASSIHPSSTKTTSPTNSVAAKPLKKRRRMYQLEYPISHAINKKALPILNFTLEEEHTVDNYISRIKKYQNKRVEFLMKNFRSYRELLLSYIKCAKLDAKVPFSKSIENTLCWMGLEFTKATAAKMFDELGSLCTDVRRQVLHSSYPALYIIFFSYLEGNTRSRNWLEQQRKTLYTTDHIHSQLKEFIQGYGNVRSIGIKDQMRFCSPWAQSGQDEERFDKTISLVGRLIGADKRLQALYHMLVMLTPAEDTVAFVQEDPTLVNSQMHISRLIYRYLSSLHSNRMDDDIRDLAQEEQEDPTLQESDVMRLSADLPDLGPADKTMLLIQLVPEVYECTRIMRHRTLPGLMT